MARTYVIRKRRFLVKTVLYIAVLSLLPIAVIGVSTNFSLAASIHQELLKANLRILKLTANAVESLVFQTQNSCRLLAGDKIFMELSYIPFPYRWYEAKSSFQNDSEMREMYRYLLIKRKIFERLESEKMGNAYVDSVYFIDLPNRLVFTSDHRMSTIDEFHDRGLFPMLEANSATTGRFERRYEDASGKRKNLLTFYYGSRDRGDSRIFVVNLQSRDFYDYLNGNVFGYENDSFAIAENDRIILSDDAYREEFASYLPIRDIPGHAQGAFSLKRADTAQGYYLTGVFSDSLHWWFLSRTNTSTLLEAKRFLSRIVTLLSVFLTFAVAAFLIVWAKRWYRPIGNIVNEIRLNVHEDISAQHAPSDEINIIERGLRSLYIERDELREKVEHIMPIYIEKYMLELLRGSNTQSDALGRPQKKPITRLVSSDLAAMIIQVDAGTAEGDGSINTSMERLVLLKELMIDRAERLTPQYQVLSDEFDRLILIVNVGQSSKTMLFELAEDIRVNVSASLRVRCYIGLSQVHPGFDFLPEAYSEAQRALSHAVFMRDDGIVHIDDIKISDGGAGRRTVYIPPSIFTAVRAGEGAEAVRQLEEYLAAMVSVDSQTAKNWTGDILLMILGRLFGLIEELDASEDFLSAILECYGDLFQKHESTAIDGIKGLVLRIGSRYHDGLKSKNEDRLTQAINHVCENFSSSALSLRSTADQVNLNPDYLGRLFKEATGSHFVDYVTNIRLSTSLELLKSTPLQVKQVAAKVGFNNTNYFIKLFKEKYGWTPMEFKNKGLLDTPAS